MKTIAYVLSGIMLIWAILGVARQIYLGKKRKNKVICVVENSCNGCSRCCKRCSRRVLEVVQDEAGRHAIVKYPDKCNACGDCLGKCKFGALKIVDRA
jgi:NAD-dependent dihydropyrimidine dehydrogenase PreA subunit